MGRLGRIIGQGLVVKLTRFVRVEGQIELVASDRSGTTFQIRLTCDNVRQHDDVLPTQVETEEVQPA